MSHSEMQQAFAFICNGLREKTEECMICTRQFKVSQLALMPRTLNLDGKLLTLRLVLTSKFGPKNLIKFLQRANAIQEEVFTEQVSRKKVDFAICI